MKILEKNGIDNTNIDGAGFNRFCAGDRDGIIKGRLNECAIAAQGNTLTIGTGEMLVSGFRVVLDTPTTFTMSSTPTVAQRYQVIAEIVVDGNSEPTFSLRTQLVAELKQDALFATEAGVGTYQVEVCRFTHATSGNIDDLLRTIDVITGGSGTGGGAVNIGKILTETLDAGMEAEVDIESRNVDGKAYLDWRFGIPRGQKGDKGIQGEKGNEIAEITSGDPVPNGGYTKTPLTFRMTNNATKTVNVNVYNGKDGTDGVDGNDGADGVGIIDIQKYGEPEQEGDYTVTTVRVRRTDDVDDDFYVYAKNGASGVKDVVAGESTEDNGYTKTPVTFNFEKGNSKTVEVMALNGKDGKDGATPEIGENGNWFINGQDTGKTSKGADGKDGTIVEGNPTEAGTEELNKIKIGDKIYTIPSGGGGGTGGGITQVTIDASSYISMADFVSAIKAAIPETEYTKFLGLSGIVNFDITIPSQQNPKGFICTGMLYMGPSLLFNLFPADYGGAYSGLNFLMAYGTNYVFLSSTGEQEVVTAITVSGTAVVNKVS